YSSATWGFSHFISHNCKAQSHGGISNPIYKLSILGIGDFRFVHIEGTHGHGFGGGVVHGNKIVVAFTHNEGSTGYEGHSVRFLRIPFLTFCPNQFSAVSAVTAEQKGNNRS